MSESSNNILVRDLSPNQLKALEQFQKKHGISTRSKAVVFMIETILQKEDSVNNLIEQKQDIEIELSELKNETRNFISSFNRLSNI